MKKTIYLALVLLLGLVSCDSTPQFTIKGEVTHAKDKVLYLESSRLEGILVVDSLKLKKDGKFSFRYKATESPEFYRLKLDNQVINLAIDSTETVSIIADAKTFSTHYEVEGSEEAQKIKELTLKQIKLQSDVNELLEASRKNLYASNYEDRLKALIDDYKKEVQMNYIYKNPNSTSAYFALFQKVNGYLLFDPLNNRDDVRSFGAVANSLNNSYPHSARAKHLYNIVIKGMRNTRKPVQKNIEIPEEKVSETGIIEVALRNVNGGVQKLSDLKGKVVLLDFTIYQHALSAAHNFALRDLYNKYQNQGLEIYQVSFDADEHFWKTSAENLPWICVRDADGVYSRYISVYNIQNIPAVFVVNRNSELTHRVEDIKEVDQIVKKLL